MGYRIGTVFGKKCFNSAGAKNGVAMSFEMNRRRVGPRFVGASVLAAVWISTASSRVAADNWPGFRGDGRSVSTDANLPLEWGPDKNIRWRVALPGKSNGSPIVWGDRIFLLQSVDAGKRRTVVCFDRTGGKQLWQSGVTYSEKESTHPDNPYCS